MDFCGCYSSDVHVEEVSVTLSHQDRCQMSNIKFSTREEMVSAALQFSSNGDETSFQKSHLVQYVTETSTSAGLSTDLLEDMDMSMDLLEATSRQSSDCDYLHLLMEDVAMTLSQAAGPSGLGNLVPGHDFAISINDPSQEDNPIIAISDEFEAMTGYSAEEIMGRSARFLNEDCPDNFHHCMELHNTSLTGKPFIGVLTNTRRDGRQFLKVLNQRGFTVANNTETGEEHWLLVSLHLDVSDILDTIDQDTFEERIPEIEAVMNKMMNTAVIAEKIMAMMCVLHQRLPHMQKPEWLTLSTPQWR